MGFTARKPELGELRQEEVVARPRPTGQLARTAGRESVTARTSDAQYSPWTYCSCKVGGDDVQIKLFNFKKYCDVLIL